ncbi:MAG: hypothetical protein R3B49_04295 [Phycisphaerales bacterium]
MNAPAGKRGVLEGARAVLNGHAEGPVARPVALAAIGAAIYGAAMGSFSVTEPARAWFVAFGAAKTPMLLAITTLVCLPAYAAMVLASGLRRDLRDAITRLVTAQASAAIALASLAPVLLVLYTGVRSHAWAILVNAGAFAVSAGVGQLIAWRLFRPLVRRSRRHALLLAFWVVTYAFVGVQLGWTLRPFVGTPGTPVQFFREGAFTNAYVAVAKIVRDAAAPRESY